MSDDCQISVVNGVRIETDGDVTHFTFDDQEIEKPTTDVKPSNPLTRIWNWWRGSRVKPYVKVRDFNDQGRDEFRLEDNPSKNGVEIGLRVDF